MANAIVGRETELAVVDEFLDLLSTGSEPLAVVIDGEPGIGKTTIWLEGIRAAGICGIEVLQARPAENEARLSYASLADLVGGVFAGIAPVLPAVQERALAAALLRAEPDEAAEPRTIATGFVAVLTALVEQSPVLIAVDDVQWLDAASEEVLTFAARRLPPRVGLLVTRRTRGGETLPLGLDRALPERVRRVVPSALSLGSLHHLVTGRLGAPLPRSMLVRVADATGGNPFFALEIARELAESDVDPSSSEPLPLPRSLEEVVAARVDDLSDAARQVVLVAAALSQPTSAAIVDILNDQGDVGEALVEAEEVGVLVSDRGRIRFAHPLLASAVYRSASPERRRQIHERLAAVVSDPEERARHLALSTTTPDDAVAAAVEEAAARAAKRGAQHAAAELYEASRRLTPEGSDEAPARRTLGEATALLAAGDIGGARALAEEAAATPFPALRAEALYTLGEIFWVAGSFIDATVKLEEALASSPDDRRFAARVYPKLVYFNVAHDPARAVEVADVAMQVLDPEQAPGALASIVQSRLWAGLLLGQTDRPELHARWVELEAAAGPDAPKSVLPLIHFHSVDDFEAARARHLVEDEWYRVRGQDDWRAERLGHRAFVELRAGEWEDAERFVEESCSVIAQMERPGPWTMPFRFRALVDASRGRTERARTTLLPLIDQANRSGRAWWEALMLSALAFVEFADEDHEAVDRVLARMHECVAEIGMRDMVPDRSEPFHVESLVALGETERARDVLERLEERGRVYPRLWITATMPRARALVLAAEGDVDGAIAALDELDAEAAAKLPFDLGWTLLVRGRLLRRAKQKRAAADTLAEALTIFDRLGSPTWAGWARAELDRVGLRRAPTELTPTELRVAELAASGLTNREVAAKAFISPKTVEANLARVYRKLGIRSRAELGAHFDGGRPQT